MKYKHIIWDYNGTLLNDLILCVDCMNILLKKYNINEISLEKYKQIFDFPVKDYYERAGFDFQKFDFNLVGVEFIDIYHSKENELFLQNDVIEVLTHFRDIGVRQSILSAREQNKLLHEVEHFGIKHFFDNISGLDNHLASGKIDNGKKLLEKIALKKNEVVLIGDTLHDFEVASELGIDCILIADGHHSKEKLLQKTNLVLDKISDLI